MKITKKDLLLLIKEELKKQLNEVNDIDSKLLDKMELLQEVIRIIESINLVSSDVVALELIDEMKKELFNDRMPTKESLTKFKNRINNKIQETLNKINMVDHELETLISESE